ncbi:hypothetical protein FS837_008295 [Tulasnella sp. UAMH 9824]|nr:hypothetical protein FS837_008295 [Tulasnella sp. UAMH 9824]
MFNQSFLTSANRSNAETLSGLSLFSRVLSKVMKASKASRIEEKRNKIVRSNPVKKGKFIVLRFVARHRFFCDHLSPTLPVSGVYLIEQDIAIPFKHVAAESPALSSLAPLPPPNPAGDETLATPSQASLSSTLTTPPTSSVSSTPPTAASCMQSSVRSPQVINELEAAEKRISELEAIIAKRRLEHAAYVQRVEKMNLPNAIKKLTEERDLFRGRLEPAKREYARKAAERELVEKECKEEVERRIEAQLRVLGAKYGLEEAAKQDAELEAKILEMQKQPLFAQHDADQGVRGAGL